MPQIDGIRTVHSAVGGNEGNSLPLFPLAPNGQVLLKAMPRALLEEWVEHLEERPGVRLRTSLLTNSGRAHRPPANNTKPR